MIHRTYLASFATPEQGTGPGIDIVVSLPGSRGKPVLDPTVYPAVPNTPAPSGWNALGTGAWYYELRGRALRVPVLTGGPGFTPRTNLGYHLAIVQLDQAGGANAGAGAIPSYRLSASLALPPVANSGLQNPGSLAFTDPAYGPVIRLNDTGEFTTRTSIYPPIFLVSFALAENKDEDFGNLGHA